MPAFNPMRGITVTHYGDSALNSTDTILIVPLGESSREIHERVSQDTADFLHLPHVEAAFPGFELAHERLGHSKPVGQFGLLEPGPDPGVLEQPGHGRSGV